MQTPPDLPWLGVAGGIVGLAVGLNHLIKSWVDREEKKTAKIKADALEAKRMSDAIDFVTVNRPRLEETIRLIEEAKTIGPPERMKSVIEKVDSLWRWKERCNEMTPSESEVPTPRR